MKLAALFVRTEKDMMPSELSSLAELEAIVADGWGDFKKVYDALLEIRDRQLYRPKYRSFEAYCAQRWNIRDFPFAAMIDDGMMKPLKKLPEGHAAQILSRVLSGEARPDYDAVDAEVSKVLAERINISQIHPERASEVEQDRIFAGKIRQWRTLNTTLLRALALTRADFEIAEEHFGARLRETLMEFRAFINDVLGDK